MKQSKIRELNLQVLILSILINFYYFIDITRKISEFKSKVINGIWFHICAIRNNFKSNLKIISKQTTPFKIWNKLEIFGNIDTRYRMDKNNFYIISSSSINFKESALKVIITGKTRKIILKIMSKILILYIFFLFLNWIYIILRNFYTF